MFSSNNIKNVFTKIGCKCFFFSNGLTFLDVFIDFRCTWPFLFFSFAITPLLPYHFLSVGVKSAYSPATSTIYSQPPPPPQRQVTALKPLAPACSVSTSYNIYPVSTSVQQPPTPISSYNLESSFASTVAATSYSGD